MSKNIQTGRLRKALFIENKIGASYDSLDYS